MGRGARQGARAAHHSGTGERVGTEAGARQFYQRADPALSDNARKLMANPAAEDGADPAPPCAMVIFGAAGDLTKRLVVPALYELVRAGRLSQQFRLVGVDLAAKTAKEWADGLAEMMRAFVGQSSAEFALD